MGYERLNSINCFIKVFMGLYIYTGHLVSFLKNYFGRLQKNVKILTDIDRTFSTCWNEVSRGDF